MGGFFGGLIAGAVTVLAFGAVLSLTAPLSHKPEISTTAPHVAMAPEPAKPAVAEDAGMDADLVELPPHAPENAAAQSDTLAGLAEAGLEPDARPETGATPSALNTPDASASVAVVVETDAPAAPPSPIAVPVSPGQEAVPETVADAPPPPEPKPEPQVAEETLQQPDEEQVAALQPEVAPEAIQPEVEQDLTQPELAPDADQPGQQASISENPIAVEGEEDVFPRAQPRVLSLPVVDADQPATSGTLVGKRVVPLTERDKPVVEQASLVTSAPVTPIEDYAAAFENPEAKPLMSIILIDDEGAFGAEALQNFPYPLSFAVSPSDPEAADKMARYRAAGFEVLALVDLHEAASAQDAEVSLSVWLDTLPETVGILEGVGSGIQGNRKLADQVAAIADGTGRGLVTQDNGLNTVQKLAARNGIPSSVVFRDFDGARQDPKVMRRFLDQAAFRAGQEGAVVMLGRLRPETISALLLWGLEDRGGRVAMAPISAVMKKEIQ